MLGSEIGCLTQYTSRLLIQPFIRQDATRLCKLSEVVTEL